VWPASGPPLVQSGGRLVGRESSTASDGLRVDGLGKKNIFLDLTSIYFDRLSKFYMERIEDFVEPPDPEE